MRCKQYIAGLSSVCTKWCAALIVALGFGPIAWGVEYPTQPVRIIVGFAPGGGSDIVARVIAQKLTELWGQSVVVSNRPGASGIIGAETVAKAPADGYTLLVSSATSTAVAPSLYSTLPYDVEKDLRIITVIGSTPALLAVNPASPAKTFDQFITDAKANGQNLFFGGSGIGSTGHLTGELLNLSANIKANHVAYKGEPPALADLMGGRLSFVFSSLPVVLPLVQSGQLRALAVTSLKRTPNAPEYPTVSESGLPGFESIAWNALYAPMAVPKPIIDHINASVVKVLAMPDVKKRLGELGIDIVGNSPGEAHAYLKSETAKWANVIKRANVKAQ